MFGLDDLVRDEIIVRRLNNLELQRLKSLHGRFPIGYTGF